jgi:WD40 repeat protein
MIASCGEDKNIFVWSISEPDITGSFGAATQDTIAFGSFPPKAIEYSRDGKILASCGCLTVGLPGGQCSSGRIVLWRMFD